jgi:Protein of unknown function (DUF4244)
MLLLMHLAQRVRSRLSPQERQTAEYALVILAAAAVAVVLIAWAHSSGKLPAFFDPGVRRRVTGHARPPLLQLPLQPPFFRFNERHHRATSALSTDEP